MKRDWQVVESGAVSGAMTSGTATSVVATLSSEERARAWIARALKRAPWRILSVRRRNQ